VLAYPLTRRYGLKLRAFGGAGLSFGDMISDAYMINTFYTTGKGGTANGLLAMVGTNLSFQMVIVYMQTQGLKKNKLRTMLFEMLTVVTFVKPGVDAYRVASGAEQVPGSGFTPLHEMASFTLTATRRSLAPFASLTPPLRSLRSHAGVYQGRGACLRGHSRVRLEQMQRQQRVPSYPAPQTDSAARRVAQN
jgi:hypothetical protein